MIPVGVEIHTLTGNSDARGTMTEVFREEWSGGVEPVQWNLFRSRAGSMRGVHVHIAHEDVMVVVEGKVTLGLRDLRSGSPTDGVVVAFELSGGAASFVVVPRGVLHGLLFLEPTTLLVGVTSYYDPDDDIGCLWSDPDLNIPWPQAPTLVSDRDRAAPSFRSLLARVAPWQPFDTVGPLTAVASRPVAETAGRAVFD
jgi:dTDP-4-dehydrorhamnose 3,5-epimerase